MAKQDVTKPGVKGTKPFPGWKIKADWKLDKTAGDYVISDNPPDKNGQASKHLEINMPVGSSWLVLSEKNIGLPTEEIIVRELERGVIL